VKRIPLLALFFVSVVEFAIEHARIDLVLMGAALAILLWGGLHSPRSRHSALRQRRGDTPKGRK
jgi:hypothetical protein